jgi:hypothetical protein
MSDILRIICVSVDCNAAAHVGGPVKVTHKTFDISAPPELVAWINAGGGYLDRSIQGVEVIEQEKP